MATLLFLHGLAGHGAEWDAVIDDLGTEHAWLAPDLRGHQGRAIDPRPLTDETFVTDAAHYLRPEDTNIVVGQSMGGIVATLLTAARPDLIDGLVLVEAGVDALSPETLGDLESWLASWPDRFQSIAEARAFFGEQRASTPTWIAGLIPTPNGFEPRFEPAVLLEIMQNLAVPDRWAAWSSIGVPTLIVRGSDGELSVDHAHAMRSTHTEPSLVQVVEISGAGHDVHLDAATGLAGTLQRFIEDMENGREDPDRVDLPEGER